MACMPLTAFAQQTYSYQRQGVYDCNQNGAYAMSVGAMSARGGVYVPVNDAAVTINTGTLVYKECVLREVIDSMRQSITAGFVTQQVQSFMTANNGNPRYPTQLWQERQSRWTEGAYDYLQNDLTSVNQSMRAPIQRLLARNYMRDLERPTAYMSCPYQGDIHDLSDNARFSFQNLILSTQPECRPDIAYLMAEDGLNHRISKIDQEMMTRLSWGNGIYGVESSDGRGNYTTQTPGSIVGANITQALQSGFRQLENANDIGQIVTAMFAGIATQVVRDNNGLSGLIRSIAGQPSYLSQVASQTSAGLVSSAVNAALQILDAARQVEIGYIQAMNSIADNLTQTIGTLRAREAACWNLIIPRVEQYAAAQDPALTLHIATSTVFSQRVINSQIAPLASTTVANIQAGQNSLNTINQLITDVTSTTSTSVQQRAIERVDQLTHDNALHTQYDLQAAQQQRTDVATAMTNLIDNTTEDWGDSNDPQVGWCNINNPAVIRMWAQEWSR